MFMRSKVAGLIFAGAIALGGQETKLDPHSSIQTPFRRIHQYSAFYQCR
jgi:hypothetical protein